MRTSFPEVCEILKEHQDRDKIVFWGVLFPELILTKYFYIYWKLTSKVVYKEEKMEAFITEKEIL